MGIIAQIGDRLGLRRYRMLRWEAVKNQRAQTREIRRAARQALVDLAEQAPPMPPGTLVKVKHHRDGYVWVVAEQVPSVGEVMDLRIVRHGFPHRVSYVAGVLSLEIVGKAEFTIGQKVQTGADEGEVIRITDDEILVRYEKITSQLRDGSSVARLNCQRWHPIHALALETDPRLRYGASNKDPAQ